MKYTFLVLGFMLTTFLVVAQSYCKFDSTFYRYNYFPATIFPIDSTPGVQIGGVLEHDANIVRVQNDDKIIVSSSTHLLRLTENGLIDGSYGTNGVFEFSQINSSGFRIQNIVIYQNNAFVYCDNFSPVYNFVFKLSDSGVIDSSFANNGFIYLDTVPNSGYYYQVMELNENNGKIYLAKLFGTELSVTRYNIIDGTLDTGFGSNGIVNNTINDVNMPDLSDMKFDINDNIILSGSNYHKGVMLVKLMSNGSFDTNFGTNGYNYFKHSSFFHYTNCNVHIDKYENYIITGSLKETFDQKYVFGIKIDNNGNMLTSFGTNGWSMHDFGIHYDCKVSSHLLGEENLIVSSTVIFEDSITGEIDSSYYSSFVLDKDGNIDYSFSPTGYFDFPVEVPDHPSEYYDEVELFSTELVGNNKLILAGYAMDCDYGFCIAAGMIARYVFDDYSVNLDDPNISLSEIVVYPNPFNDELHINTTNLENAKLSIYDIIGRKVHEIEFVGSVLINTNNFKKGLYVLHIEQMNGVRTSKIIVKP